MDVCWLQWVGIDAYQLKRRGGTPIDPLLRVDFLDDFTKQHPRLDGDPEGNFGFIDPARILRGCSLMPVFSLGSVADQAETVARKGFGKGGSKVKDYISYWVNMYVIYSLACH